jgi:phospholipase C
MADGYNEMTMLSPEKIPILTTLANEYALFDHYFASYPGPTNPNRLFVHCGTAAGSLGDEQRIGQMKNKTIQKILEENGHSWRYYYEDQPEDWFLFISDFNDTFEDTTKFLQME